MQRKFPRVAGYEIYHRIGEGGMADVYLATQLALERRVALKVLAGTLAADRSFTSRFVSEAKTIAKLSHPHIVPIYEVGESVDGLPFFSMQLLQGGDLESRLEEGIDQKQLASTLRAVLSALAHAHEAKFIHRDVTPKNILFDVHDTPMLTDFGIARALSRSTRITQSGMSVGTTFYMSPEQARGREVDLRSDIYSLGVVAYQALMGDVPFNGTDSFAIAYAHVFSPVPKLPPRYKRWQEFIDRSLAKEPQNRFRDCAEAEATLLEIEKDLPSNAKLPRVLAATTRARPRLAIQSRWPLRAVAAVAALVVVGSLIAGFRGLDLSEPQAQRSRIEAAALDSDRGSTPSAPEQELVATTAVAASPQTATMPERRVVSAKRSEQASAVEAQTDRALVMAGTKTTPSDDGTAANVAVSLEAEQPVNETGAQTSLDTIPPHELVPGVLEQAQQAIARWNLVTPSGKAAFDLYRAAIEAEPDSQAARDGLATIVERYILLIADAGTSAERADVYVNRAEFVIAELAKVDARRAAQLQASLEDTLVVREIAATKRRQMRLASITEPAGLVVTAGGGQTISRLVPAMVTVTFGDRQLEVARAPVTVAEFRAFVEDRQPYQDDPLVACRDRESLLRSYRGRNWKDVGFGQGDDHPVVCVRHQDAQQYAEWLSERTGHTYRLMRSDEWVALASRAVSPGSSCSRANIADLQYAATYGGEAECSDGFVYTAPVGIYASSPLSGLGGNVREWLEDCEIKDGWFRDNVENCSRRAVGGRSFASPAAEPADEVRFLHSDSAFNTVGFRLVREN